MAKKQKVAIFDIDGTVFRSSLLIELVEALIDAGLFPVNVRGSYAKEKIAWRNRKGSYDAYIMAVVKTFETHLKGIDYDDFNEVAKEVIASKKDEVYRYTRDLIRKLKEEGYYLLAISQSPKSVLEPFCKRLGFDKVYGRIYEIGPTNRFTGSVALVHLIANKSNIVKRAMEKEGLSLDQSVGVGDTEGDLSFLELVHYPVCFNPNSTLYRHARRNRWPVVVERKDVVYTLNAHPPFMKSSSPVRIL